MIKNRTNRHYIIGENSDKSSKRDIEETKQSTERKKYLKDKFQKNETLANREIFEKETLDSIKCSDIIPSIKRAHIHMNRKLFRINTEIS